MPENNEQLDKFNKAFNDYFDCGNFQEILQNLKEIALSKGMKSSSAIKAITYIIDKLTENKDINVNVNHNLEETKKCLADILGKFEEPKKE